MGRHPKLSDREWAEVGRRYVSKESSGRKLAAEFGVSEAAIRKRFGSQREEILSAATDLATAERRVESMPESARASVRTLADQLKRIGENVTRAAIASSESAAFLSEAARDRAREAVRETVDDKGRKLDPIAAMEADELQIAANRALSPAMRLIAATMGKSEPEDPEQTVSAEELHAKLLG